MATKPREAIGQSRTAVNQGGTAAIMTAIGYGLSRWGVLDAEDLVLVLPGAMAVLTFMGTWARNVFTELGLARFLP